MIEVEIINQSAFDLPAYATEGAAGLDIRANISEAIVLSPLERQLIPTGLFVAIPLGYEIQIRPRSGLAFKHGITVLNTPGTIDADYRGEIKVLLVNLSNEPFSIEPGERIAQMVLAKHETLSWKTTEELPSTERGAGGFGSTGVK
jgi:dUTP pyrophosphatase